MSIQHGDILLKDNKIFGRNGDLAHGDGQEQFLGAIIEATPGNFRKYPTLAANLVTDINSPLDSRRIAAKVQNAIFLDGWRGIELRIEQSLTDLNITLVDAVKETDETQSLV